MKPSVVVQAEYLENGFRGDARRRVRGANMEPVVQSDCLENGLRGDARTQTGT